MTLKSLLCHAMPIVVAVMAFGQSKNSYDVYYIFVATVEIRQGRSLPFGLMCLGRKWQYQEPLCAAASVVNPGGVHGEPPRRSHSNKNL